MSKIISYDEINNVLHISTEKPKELKKSLRGFVISLADNQEEAKLIESGDYTALKLAPVLAMEEQEAIDFIEAQGKIPLTVVSYEYLKIQMELLEDLAQKEDITLIVDNIANVTYAES